ncbi:hypothetical protein [Pseudoalteromonas maricaloris]|uniref:DUF4303 domain-containing protein n=1 Tax=Pseudoalteromonas maricaloris TaxID=184924 RepID=A0A8I2KM24_9GAMM|nr:hypothetical protein [Pseudoalteromonas maricaloris]NLR22249.1 hypothetical protein [Pseudoalteromonas maricaloris]WOX31562.1 hypothetical protein R5H13_21725 [Pseudoalteromonas maricaloris]
MFDKNTLIEAYENVLITLIKKRINELKFYVNQSTYSHMSLSVEFWHYDVNWNIYSLPESRFEQHKNVASDEFIILSDFEDDCPEVSKLRDIFESWEDIELVEDEDENMDMLFKLSHEALAEALCGNEVKPLLLDIFAENKALKNKPFNELIKVEDPDGRFDLNFIAAASQ